MRNSGLWTYVGCMSLIVPLGLFLIVGDIARGFVWLKWALQ